MIRIELSDTAAITIMWVAVVWAVVKIAVLIKKGTA